MNYFRILLLALLISLSACSKESEPELTRYYALADLAKSEVNKDLSKAEDFAKELLHLSSIESRDWNYGNAIHIGNMVLGQVALRKGEIEKAEMYLLRSGQTPGSPQLDTFGPNMSLAKELLEAERPIWSKSSLLQGHISSLSTLRSFHSLRGTRLKRAPCKGVMET